MCTMLQGKDQNPKNSAQEYRKELEYLYARRVAVETLIRSLEAYQRFQPKRESHHSPRKSA